MAFEAIFEVSFLNWKNASAPEKVNSEIAKAKEYEQEAKKKTKKKKKHSVVGEWQWHRLHMLNGMLAFFTCTFKQFQMFWHYFSCFDDFLFRFPISRCKFMCFYNDSMLAIRSRSHTISSLQCSICARNAFICVIIS